MVGLGWPGVPHRGRGRQRQFGPLSGYVSERCPKFSDNSCLGARRNYGSALGPHPRTGRGDAERVVGANRERVGPQFHRRGQLDSDEREIDSWTTGEGGCAEAAGRGRLGSRADNRCRTRLDCRRPSAREIGRRGFEILRMGGRHAWQWAACFWRVVRLGRSTFRVRSRTGQSTAETREGCVGRR